MEFKTTKIQNFEEPEQLSDDKGSWACSEPSRIKENFMVQALEGQREEEPLMQQPKSSCVVNDACPNGGSPWFASLDFCP